MLKRRVTHLARTTRGHLLTGSERPIRGASPAALRQTKGVRQADEWQGGGHIS